MEKGRKKGWEEGKEVSALQFGLDAKKGTRGGGGLRKKQKEDRGSAK